MRKFSSSRLPYWICSRQWIGYILVLSRFFCYLTVQTAPCYVLSFWHNIDVWQTDGNAIASTALAMRALWRAVKIDHLFQTQSHHSTNIFSQQLQIIGEYQNLVKFHLQRVTYGTLMSSKITRHTRWYHTNPQYCTVYRINNSIAQLWASQLKWTQQQFS